MQLVSRQPSETAPARIQPLSVLPVFLDLAGKRAVVAGGTDGAAWKAELLAAAGATPAAVDAAACACCCSAARTCFHGCCRSSFTADTASGRRAA